SGKVVASAKPKLQRKLVGTSLAGDPWFRAASACSSCDAYIVDDVKSSPLHDNRHALVYAKGIRKEGKLDGRLVGTLGVYFDW
ncbi:chemotaxis protein, partial [Rhizobium ruizarguesonis]